MNEVRAKKFLGQHFLTDESIAKRIVDSLSSDVDALLEIGPGMGVLTKYLITRGDTRFRVVEIDRESVASALYDGSFAIIGNFPYNISSQILFRVFDLRSQVVEVVGMFQKEVAERVAAGPGSKTYGILSVLLSAFYDIEYLFTVSENVFNPPPKVKSAVIKLRRNDVKALECDEKLFVQVVKAGFNQRRKTLRNALRTLGLPLDNVDATLLANRAEQLSVAQFIEITKTLQQCL